MLLWLVFDSEAKGETGTIPTPPPPHPLSSVAFILVVVYVCSILSELTL